MMFIKILEKRGAKARLYDPLLPKSEISNMPHVLKKSLTEAVESTDCLVILNEHFKSKRLNLKKLRTVMKMPAAIVDLAGIIEPQKVERKGFRYRGLGRGVEKR